jgi:hypothetical protein
MMLNVMLMKEIFSKNFVLVKEFRFLFLFFYRYIETSALDATNVEQAFRTLIADIYRHWAARVDSMANESNTNPHQNIPQTIKPGYSSATNPPNTNSCCGSFT